MKIDSHTREELLKEITDLYKEARYQNVLLDEMFPTQNYLHGITGDYRQTVTRLEKELLKLRELLSGEESPSEALQTLFDEISILHRPKFIDGEEKNVTLSKSSSPDFKWNDSLTLYQQFQRELEKNAEEWTHTMVGSPFQDFGLELIFKDDNTFNKKALRYHYSKIGNSTKEVRKRFLENLEKVFNCDLEEVMHRYCGVLKEIENLIASLDGTYEEEIIPHERLIPSLKEFSSVKLKIEGKLKEVEKKKAILKGKLLRSTGWGKYLEEVADYLFSLDPFNLFKVYKVDRLGRIFPVDYYDQYAMQDLMGYEKEKSILVEETRRFLLGEDTNNIFIFGPPGTGKSSTVNALITTFEDLRLVVMDKHQVALLSAVYSQIREVDYKFIIFFDELSYYERDMSYKKLQEAMEGVVDRLPQNTKVYAAANTRNPVIYEGGEEETPDDKSALADRFGIKIHFRLPDDQTQKEILRHYASQKNISLSDKELIEGFKKWCKENDHLRPNCRNIRDYVRSLRVETQ